ncbi:polysaccharide pyruvyl transferase family protein [Pseudoflavonifractor sp. 524-17]|uniref:polysaccharide pyruvyl transferase family protein n=1 Tax=Pseudoflavonifractor sp. 524-17 TaxID=2304577 RepID=UPI00137A3F7A|nr:polysaccharide pyruvyl transferase family protein [Pseudoflavonifractor sp. 524-17]
MERDAMRNSPAGEVGILTFHCSDNFGAMLQAYALKEHLRASGVAADIVRYEPPFLTGRHWLIPYVPQKGLGRRLRYAAWGVWHNLQAYQDFAARRANMRRFRMDWLVDREQPKIWFLSGLKKLPYRCYVVGSDQIWNPNITCGLRRAYFGAFESGRKERVVAYGASLGSASLPPEYERQFLELVRHVDAVSVREAGAAPYVQRCFAGEVTAVLDPVFFLGKDAWQTVERPPEQKNYILAYTTEPNRDMAEYVQALSHKTDLPVVELRTGAAGVGVAAEADKTAGPAEFLGYVHHAAYVVSNSFHAAAFSILYEKQFLIFSHSQVNERLASLLALHGLEDRLCPAGAGEITTSIHWPAVAARTAEAVKVSHKFLLKNVVGRLE